MTLVMSSTFVVPVLFYLIPLNALNCCHDVHQFLLVAVVLLTRVFLFALPILVLPLSVVPALMHADST